MATNTIAPFGLVYSRQKIGAAPTAQKQQFLIKSGYSTNISVGDVVAIGTSGNQGYVTLAANNPTSILGVFAGVLPYYDKTLQATSHGLNASYSSGANPAADIPCLVITDPFAVYRAQVANGYSWSVTWPGQNINWLTSGTYINGSPNGAGVSQLGLDGSTVATTNTLPLRIEGQAGVSGGPQDPANVNPWIEVSFNPSLMLMLQGTGV